MPAAPQLGVHPGSLDQPITQASRVTRVSPGFTARSAAPGCTGEDDGLDAGCLALVEQAAGHHVELRASSADVIY